jgi:hypothetical protein
MEDHMGYTLSSKSGPWCSFNHATWPWVLAIAFAFGWRPAGTAAPTFNEGGESDPDPHWDGGYFYNDYQEVIEPDARALGEALHRALETARKARDGDPDARADLDQRLAEAHRLLGAEAGDQFYEPVEPELFDPGVAAGIREFADMALKGPFLIG